MKEAFEKIKERLEESSMVTFYFDGKPPKQCVPIEDALSIVSEVEAEFGKDINVLGNGWIDVKDRLPEAYDISSKPILERPWYLVSRECGLCAIVNYETILGKDAWVGNSWVYKDVIAWMPLPEPYKPET